MMTAYIVPAWRWVVKMHCFELAVWDTQTDLA